MSQKRPKRRRPTRQSGPQPEQQGSYLARASLGGPTDVNARTPNLKELPHRTVTMFGLGALGAPAALELSRAGVRDLRLVDPDHIEAGNAARWPLGMTSVGVPKAAALLGFIEANYPYVNPSAYGLRVGAPRLEFSNDPSELDLLGDLLTGADLVFDATAEPGVWHALSDLAAELAIPYIHIWATPGAWGGAVARVIPGRPGCWLCIEHHVNRGTIASPNADPAGAIQPPGCDDPTFTGTSFDLGIISLLGVRLAVSTLSATTEGGYPDLPWDVAVVNLRDADGRPILSLDTHTLTPHPECQRCAAT